MTGAMAGASRVGNRDRCETRLWQSPFAAHTAQVPVRHSQAPRDCGQIACPESSMLPTLALLKVRHWCLIRTIWAVQAPAIARSELPYSVIQRSGVLGSKQELNRLVRL